MLLRVAARVPELHVQMPAPAARPERIYTNSHWQPGYQPGVAGPAEPSVPGVASLGTAMPKRSGGRFAPQASAGSTPLQTPAVPRLLQAGLRYGSE